MYVLYFYLHICMYTHTFIYCMRRCLNISTFVYMYIQASTEAPVHNYAFMFMCVYIYCTHTRYLYLYMICSKCITPGHILLHCIALTRMFFYFPHYTTRQDAGAQCFSLHFATLAFKNPSCSPSKWHSTGSIALSE